MIAFGEFSLEDEWQKIAVYSFSMVKLNTDYKEKRQLINLSSFQMPWSGILLTGLRGGGGDMTYWLCQAMILIWLIRHVGLLFSFAKPIPIHICCLVNLRISKFSIRNKTYTDCNICRIFFFVFDIQCQIHEQWVIGFSFRM